MKKLKNYKSRSASDPISAITKILTSHKARQIMQEYNDEGLAVGITFSIEINGRHLVFKLPARVENVAQILYGDKPLTEIQKKQAYTTAWANIRDWIDAQMAMIDTEMVKIEEIFLPYMLNDKGQTVYDFYKNNQFQLGQGEN